MKRTVLVLASLGLAIVTVSLQADEYPTASAGYVLSPIKEHTSSRYSFAVELIYPALGCPETRAQAYAMVESLVGRPGLRYKLRDDSDTIFFRCTVTCHDAIIMGIVYHIDARFILEHSIPVETSLQARSGYTVMGRGNFTEDFTGVIKQAITDHLTANFGD